MTKVIAYLGNKVKVSVDLKRAKDGSMEAVVGDVNVFNNDKFADATFLVPIDNTIAAISRDKFMKYLMAYSISTSL